MTTGRAHAVSVELFASKLQSVIQKSHAAARKPRDAAAALIGLKFAMHSL